MPCRASRKGRNGAKGAAARLRTNAKESTDHWNHRDEPDDYVVATGETHTVRELCELAFGEVGLDYNDYVKIDPQFYRPAEVELLVGDAARARVKLGWKPTVTFARLIQEMVRSDLDSMKGS